MHTIKLKIKLNNVEECIDCPCLVVEDWPWCKHYKEYNEFSINLEPLRLLKCIEENGG